LEGNTVDKALQFDLKAISSVSSLFRVRAEANPKHAPFVMADKKGKEQNAPTYANMNGRAEKTAMLLRTKGQVNPGDYVLLVYRRSELVDYVVALMACFYAGVVAVPIVFSPLSDQLNDLGHIMELTGARIALSTDVNFKSLTKDWESQGRQIQRPVDWWKTEGKNSTFE
jgi:acyl-CoA synthetase (AMP-forming)/AMP-acid ligase II